MPDSRKPDNSSEPGPVTRALSDPEQTPADALKLVLPHVYGELRNLAARTLRPGDPASLRPTDLLHESYLRLTREKTGWSNRANLMVAAAVAMRRAIVDHVRRKRAAKRGGDRERKDELERLAIHDQSFDTLVVEDALRQLEGEDPKAAEVAELRLFGGFDVAECAQALNVSERTVERRWRFARAWLVSVMDPEERGDDR